LLIPRDQGDAFLLRQGDIDGIATTQAALGSQPGRKSAQRPIHSNKAMAWQPPQMSGGTMGKTWVIETARQGSRHLRQQDLGTQHRRSLGCHGFK
jgi:hypothetical protein